MKKNKKQINAEYRKLNSDISAQANISLSGKGARAILFAAFVFIFASAGTAVILFYLLVNIIDYMGFVLLNEAILPLLSGMILLFSAPAIAGMRSAASSVADGREASLPELFIAFSTLERALSTYFGVSFIFLKYILFVPIFLFADVAFEIFGEDIPVYASLAVYLVWAALFWGWFILLRRSASLFHYLWGEKLPFFKALRASFKNHLRVRPMSGEDMLSVLISVFTCFVYYIFHAGPLFAVKAELYARKEKELKINYFVKIRKDGQK